MQLQTHTIQDAITHLQAMPKPMQLEVFHFIDFLNTRIVNPNQQARDELDHGNLPTLTKQQFFQELDEMFDD